MSMLINKQTNKRENKELSVIYYELSRRFEEKARNNF